MPEPQSPTREQIERRKVIRHAVEEACVIVLLRQGGGLACTLLNLSVDGCMIRTKERFSAGIQVRVEISFKVNGIAFRFNGVIRWSDGRDLAGIAFVDVVPRRREALAEVIEEVEAAHAAKAAQGGAEAGPPDLAVPQQAQQQPEPASASRESARPEPSREKQAGPEPGRQEQARQEPAKREATAQQEQQLAEQRAAERVLAAWTAQDQAAREAARWQPQRRAVQPAVASKAEPAQATEAHPAESAAARPVQRERRAQQRHSVDTSVVIHMVRAGAQLPGRILDLSAGGCRIRVAEPFPVGIYTRVEVEFYVEGLPFRLAGVVQAIHDRARFLVGIRFLDMSQRKREQLEQLMAELAEHRRTEGNRE